MRCIKRQDVSLSWCLLNWLIYHRFADRCRDIPHIHFIFFKMWQHFFSETIISHHCFAPVNSYIHVSLDMIQHWLWYPSPSLSHWFLSISLSFPHTWQQKKSAREKNESCGNKKDKKKKICICYVTIFVQQKKSDFPFCPSALSWDFSLCFMTVQ